MKKYFFSALAVIAICFFCCKSYKQVTLVPGEFYSNAEVIDNFGNYDVYINGNNGTFLLKNPSISNGTITGSPQQINDSAKIAGIKNPSGRKQKNEHKYDLNIYTDKEINVNETASADSNSTTGSGFELKKEDVKQVSLFAHDKKDDASNAMWTVIILVLAALILAGLIYLLAAASSDASNSSSNSSNSSSSGSSSGSSSSGCYIATMVYGSYEAPEVMVLRKFRDERLSKTIAGRTFIKTYYKYSPRLVEKLKNKKTANKIIKTVLDKWVDRLSR